MTFVTLTRRNPESIAEKFPASYNQAKQRIANLKADLEGKMGSDLSELVEKAINDVLNYLGTLDGELVHSFFKDRLPIREAILDDRLTLIGQLIKAIEKSKKSQSDTHIVRCYHLMITTRIHFGYINFSNLKDLLTNTFRQMKEGIVQPIVPPMECPISKEPIEHPVILPSGHVFEKELIVKWIEKKGTNPITRDEITTDDLIPASIRSRVSSYQQGLWRDSSSSVNSIDTSDIDSDENIAIAIAIAESTMLI